MKRPAFQFYPADWRNDAALRMCSIAARGLWWEMICLMHMADPYGHLVAAGRPIGPVELARIVGESTKDLRRWLAELEKNVVFSTTEDGVIYSRRMVRDEKQRKEWRNRQGKHRDIARDIPGDVTDTVTHGVTPMSHRASDLRLRTASSSSKRSTGNVPVDNFATGETWAQHWMARGKALGMNARKGETERAYCERVIARDK